MLLMFRKNEFRAALARADKSTADVAKALNIDVSTLTRKMSGQSDFFRDEIEKIRIILGLDWSAVHEIFFAQDVE